MARGLAQLQGLTVEMPETNLVFFDTSGTGLTAEAVADRLREHGVLVSTMGRHRGRACTHLDVDAGQVDEAVAAMRAALAA